MPHGSVSTQEIGTEGSGRVRRAPGPQLDISLACGWLPTHPEYMSTPFDPLQTNVPIRPRAGKPEKVTEDGQRLKWRWFNPVLAVFLLFFSVFWNGFLVFWYSIVMGMFRAPAQAVANGYGASANAALNAETVSQGLNWIFAIFPLLHVAVGVGMLYYTICLFVNRTDISLENGTLEVRHGPLPWRGNRKLSQTAIAQLFVAKRLSYSRKNGTSEHFDLMVLDPEQIITPLLKDMPTLEHAKYVEQWVEQKLGIRNRSVEGEVTF